jgi:hypothetical protein
MLKAFAVVAKRANAYGIVSQQQARVSARATQKKSKTRKPL